MGSFRKIMALLRWTSYQDMNDIEKTAKEQGRTLTKKERDTIAALQQEAADASVIEDLDDLIRFYY
jgi:hypothetical protein